MATVSMPQHEPSIGIKDRGFHQDIAASYMLPNDSPEHARLERQARLLSAIMDHKVVHAPLDGEKAERVLDIGCGTGVVTDILAEQYPQAQVFGVDLSIVPQIRQFQKNVHFLQGNVLTRSPKEWTPVRGGKCLSQTDGLFDLCFSRLFINQLPNPETFVKREFELLKPGGFIEMHELSGPLVGENGTQVPDIAWWLEWTEAFERRTGATIRTTGEAVAGWMKQAGFVDIQTKQYMWPVGLHAASEAIRGQLRDLPEDVFEHDMFEVYSTFIMRLHAQGALGKESTARVLEGCKKCVLTREKYYHRFIVTVGRKPE